MLVHPHTACVFRLAGMATYYKSIFQHFFCLSLYKQFLSILQPLSWKKRECMVTKILSRLCAHDILFPDLWEKCYE